MTTFGTQRLNPDIAKAEERLTEILTGLGKNRIPELEVGDFYEDLINEPWSGGKLETFEEQIGIRLGLRILDQVMLEQFNKVDELETNLRELQTQLDRISQEKNSVSEENLFFRKELASLKKQQGKIQVPEQKGQAVETDSLRNENKKLKAKLANLAKQYDQLAFELRFDKGEPNGDNIYHNPSNQLPVPNAKSPKKRKSPVPDYDAELSDTPVKTSKRLLIRKLSANEALFLSKSTEAHVDDLSYVPETMAMTENAAAVKQVKYISIPETPEKLKNSKSSLSLTPEKVQCKENKTASRIKQPTSPVISRTLSRGGKKLRLISREKGDGVCNPLPIPEKDRQDSIKNALKTCDLDDGDGAGVKKVGKVPPSIQSEIDKKSFHDLDIDFPVPKRSKKLIDVNKKVTPIAPQSDTDSDFESPNLLVKRSSRRKDSTRSSALSEEVEFKTPKLIDIKGNGRKVDINDEIETFASPEESSSNVKNELKKSRSLKPPQRIENRWGIQVDEITASQKKRLNSQKQSKIDGFFKNPPPRQQHDFKRVNHADTDMERALQLSKEVKINVAEESIQETPKEIKIESNGHEDDPGYAYVGEVVRSKEERKQLYGFDCRECEEYYHMKIEEGFSKDQIMKMLNKCSRHRGNFKPPLTPEKFWDADIVEGDPNSPRNKTQVGQPLRSRARRRAENREKRKILKNLENMDAQS